MSEQQTDAQRTAQTTLVHIKEWAKICAELADLENEARIMRERKAEAEKRLVPFVVPKGVDEGKFFVRYADCYLEIIVRPQQPPLVGWHTQPTGATREELLK